MLPDDPSVASGKPCPGCGTQLPANALFCLHCGASQPQLPPDVCRACGAPLPGKARFCAVCGTPVVAAQLAPGPPLPVRPAAAPAESARLSPQAGAAFSAATPSATPGAAAQPAAEASPALSPEQPADTPIPAARPALDAPPALVEDQPTDLANVPLPVAIQTPAVPGQPVPELTPASLVEQPPTTPGADAQDLPQAARAPEAEQPLGIPVAAAQRAPEIALTPPVDTSVAAVQLAPADMPEPPLARPSATPAVPPRPATTILPATARVCQACAAELPEKGRFCAVCGTPVAAVPSVAQVAAPSPAGQSPGAPVARVQPASGAPVAAGNACRACGARLPAGAQFCGLCGASVAAIQPAPQPPPAPEAVCRACGARLLAGAQFCGLCGAPVAVARPPTGVPPAPGPSIRRRPIPRRSPPAMPSIAPPTRTRSKQGWAWALLGLALLLVFVGAAVWALPRVLVAWQGRPPAALQDRGSTPAAGGATAPAASVTSQAASPSTPENTSPAVATHEITRVTMQPMTAGVMDLPAYLTGAASDEATPEKGVTLRAGAAKVVIQPGALEQRCTAKAELSSDGLLRVTLDPPQALAVPAWVTLPLPPGAALGEDPRTWPVAVLQSQGREPLILQPESVGPTDFVVAVPHFSDLIPDLLGDVLDKAGQAAKELGKQLDAYSPKQIDVALQPLQDYGTGAKTSSIKVKMQAKASTPKNGGFPELKDGKMLPEWFQFNAIKVEVGVADPDKPDKYTTQTLTLVNGSGELDLPLPSNRKPGTQIVVTLYTESGVQLASRALAAPNASLWTMFECQKNSPQGASWLDFRVHYISDTQLIGYPDATYAKDHNPATPGVPASVYDVCEAATKAYNAYQGAGYFDAPKNSPSLPILAYLQPWEESNSSNYNLWDMFSNNYIKLSVTGGRSWKVQFTETAHELAHLFQQEYATGLGGGKWLHDASAEYLALKVWGASNEQAGEYVGSGDPAWLRAGMMSSSDTDNYAGASFLGFLSSKDGVDVPALWKEGASGVSNLSGWASYLDGVVKKTRPEGLKGSWTEFATAYLVDHQKWGSWAGVNLRHVMWEGTVELSHDQLFVEQAKTIPPLAGGALRVNYTGPEKEVLIIYRVRTAIEKPVLFAGEGLEADGKGAALQVQQNPPGYLAALSLRAAFKGGVEKGLIESRLVAANPVWDTSAQEAKFSVWALPEVQGVMFDLPNLRWEASALEQAQDSDGAKLFAGYEIIGHRKGVSETMLATLPGDTEEWPLQPELLVGDKAMSRICVRLRDAYGNIGPEGCPPIMLTGRYTGTTTYKEANFDLSKFQDEDLDGDGKADITRQDCEEALKGIVGQTTPIAWEFVPKDKDGGEAYMYSYKEDSKTWSQAELSEDQPAVFEYKVNKDRVTIDATQTQGKDRVVLHFEGNIRAQKDVVSVEGSFKWSFDQEGLGLGDIKGIWQISR